MHTASSTLRSFGRPAGRSVGGLLPLPIPNHGARGVHPGQADADLRSRWRKLRDAIVPPQERVLRAARRGRPVALGTAMEPWETLPERRALLGCLDGFSGLPIQLTCRNDQVLDDVDLLAWLDRDHAVRVDFRFDVRVDLSARRAGASGTGLSPYAHRLLAAAETLAAHGIETRLILEPVADAAPDLESLRLLAGTAARRGLADLLVPDGAPESWARAVEPVRLGVGFPVERAGRG